MNLDTISKLLNEAKKSKDPISIVIGGMPIHFKKIDHIIPQDRDSDLNTEFEVSGTVFNTAPYDGGELLQVLFAAQDVSAIMRPTQSYD